MGKSPMKSVTDLRANLEGFAARYAAQRVRDGADPQPLLYSLDGEEPAFDVRIAQNTVSLKSNKAANYQTHDYSR